MRRRGRTSGLLLVLAGLTLAAWATSEAGETDVAQPDRVLVEGPYALTRHPMYLGWTLTYVGALLVTASGWLALFLPALLAVVRRQARGEERYMEELFGSYGVRRRRSST